MKSNKHLMAASLGAGLMLMAAQSYAADAPRRLSIEDDASAVINTQPIEPAVELMPVEGALVIESEIESASLDTVGVTEATDAIDAIDAIDVAADSSIDTVDQERNDGDLSADPFEGINRKIFAANDLLDRGITKPVAKGYKKIIPAGIRRCASNMFDNLGTPYTAVNNVLQGKIKSAGQDIGRVVVNSVLGIGGCFDVATKFGIPKHDEDFGQTLGVWGVPSGRYVVLPFLGPSTVRDALAKPIDMLANPIGYITKVRVRNSLTGYRLVDARTNALETTDLLDANALDKYVMVRDAWTQRREAKVRDEDGSYDGVSHEGAATQAPARQVEQ